MEELLHQILTLIEQKVSKRKIVIIETSSNSYYENIAEVLEKYANQLELSIWKSNEYGTLNNFEWKNAQVIANQEELLDRLKDTDLVFIPCLSKDLLVKAALCMSDTSSSFALQVALLQKKEIIALNSDIHLKSDSARLLGYDKNEGYAQMLDIYREKLVDFGLGLVSIFDFEKVFEHWLKEL